MTVHPHDFRAKPGTVVCLVCGIRDVDHPVRDEAETWDCLDCGSKNLASICPTKCPVCNGKRTFLTEAERCTKHDRAKVWDHDAKEFRCAGCFYP